MMPAAIWPQARWNGACENAKMISAALTIEVTSVRANGSLRSVPMR